MEVAAGIGRADLHLRLESTFHLSDLSFILIFSLSLRFSISQSVQHLWGCLPNDLAAPI
jgi:hypothetical protein